uniref:GekBS139P n=1 Tax=Gekko japonicus TaxID=146911 RepID=Q5EI12_GEKJA|nr:GekBS139P [Gekko japonicus]
MEGGFGSDFGSSGSGKLDPGLIMEQVKVQIAVANAQELLQRMTDKCFRKCIGKPGGSLDNSEQKCIAMCMDRYMDAWKHRVPCLQLSAAARTSQHVIATRQQTHFPPHPTPSSISINAVCEAGANVWRAACQKVYEDQTGAGTVGILFLRAPFAHTCRRV